MAYVYIVFNLIAFSLVWMDKRLARRGRRRIPERVFFYCALLFGAAGILLGMYTFRHKTRHGSFVLSIPLLLLFNIACYYYLRQHEWL